jgi:excisionase family DNA binding protein
MELPEILSRLEKLEDAFLAGLQEVRCIHGEIQKQGAQTATLEPLLEADKVAEILGVDVGYVYSQARAKQIPSVKLGKYRKFSPSQLKKWLERKSSP